MASIHKSVEIKAPVKRVFSYVEDPRNELEWMMSMTDIQELRGSGVGTHFRWDYKMAGLHFHGDSDRIEDIEEKKIVDRTKGDIESTWTYSFEPLGESTRLNLDIDYKIPVPVLGKLAEKAMLKHNEREAEQSLLNIKEKLEAKP
jgi:uncharacterized membrane protein